MFSVLCYNDEFAFGLDNLGKELAYHGVGRDPVSAFDEVVLDYVSSVDNEDALVVVFLYLLLG